MKFTEKVIFKFQFKVKILNKAKGCTTESKGSPHLQTSFGVISQFLLVYWDIILGEPVTKQDWSTKSLLFVDVRKMFHSNSINVLISPQSLFIFNQPMSRRNSKY